MKRIIANKKDIMCIQCVGSVEYSGKITSLQAGTYVVEIKTESGKVLGLEELNIIG